jgi:hypothetical protein
MRTGWQKKTCVTITALGMPNMGFDDVCLLSCSRLSYVFSIERQNRVNFVLMTVCLLVGLISFSRFFKISFEKR